MGGTTAWIGRRLMPGVDALQTLRFNSHMLVTVLSTRNLSLW